MKLLTLPLLAALAVTTGGIRAADLQSAEVTRVYNDVKIFSSGATAKPAKVGNTISGRTSLQTGRNSRSELRFQDNTLTRIGQNSVFSFVEGTRDLQLDQGTLLLQVPKRAGGARIRTATVTAAITGTTIMMEYHAGKWCKIIVLEGSLGVYLNEVKKRVQIKPGEMLVMPANATRIPAPVNVDIARLQKSSALAGAQFFPALPADAQAKINQTVANQQTMIRTGALTSAHAKGQAPPPTVRTAQATQNAANSARVPIRDARWWERRPRQ